MGTNEGNLLKQLQLLKRCWDFRCRIIIVGKTCIVRSIVLEYEVTIVSIYLTFAYYNLGISMFDHEYDFNQNRYFYCVFH